jgi:flagellar hook-basal body complex protein FliE
MAANISQALSAYANSAARAGSTGLASRDEAPGESFAGVMRGMLEQAVETGKQGERASTQAVLGRADINEVVMAVNNAEVTLQTVVAVRDRVISAYQDILRMPI